MVGSESFSNFLEKLDPNLYPGSEKVGSESVSSFLDGLDLNLDPFLKWLDTNLDLVS